MPRSGLEVKLWSSPWPPPTVSHGSWEVCTLPESSCKAVREPAPQIWVRHLQAAHYSTWEKNLISNKEKSLKDSFICFKNRSHRAIWDYLQRIFRLSSFLFSPNSCFRQFHLSTSFFKRGTYQGERRKNSKDQKRTIFMTLYSINQRKTQAGKLR